jgi:hypothetical protein
VADFVDSTVRDIDSRLEELKQEVVKLEAARAALVGARRGPGRPAATNGATTRRRAPSGRRAGRPRGRRSGNTRANQALDIVRDNPGVTIPDIAKQMDIEPNYLYRVMPRLVSEGQVRREGQGWHPAGSGNSEASGDE